MGAGKSEPAAASDAIHEEALGFSLAQGGFSVRPIAKEDLKTAAGICQEAFNAFNASVGLGPEFPPTDVVDVPSGILNDAFKEGFQGFVAVNADGEVVGSNMVDMRDDVAGIGPITVSTSVQSGGVGKLLMKAVMKAAAEKGMRSVRLAQVASNRGSFSLYLGLGFDPYYACGQYEGFLTPEAASGDSPGALACQPLAEGLVEACSRLHFRVCGLHRRGDIAAAVGGPNPACVVLDASGAVVAYTTGSFLSGHTVAASEEAFKSLVAAQSRAVQTAQAAGAPLAPTTFFVPHRYPQLLRWLARSGFRLQRQVTQMGYGPYTQPANGFYFPSISY